jgi:hypothetical protein
VWSHSWDSPQSASNGVQIKLRLLVGLAVSRYQTPLQFWAAIKALAPRKPKTFQDARLRSRCRHQYIHEDGRPLMALHLFASLTSLRQHSARQPTSPLRRGSRNSPHTNTQ